MPWYLSVTIGIAVGVVTSIWRSSGAWNVVLNVIVGVVGAALGIQLGSPHTGPQALSAAGWLTAIGYALLGGTVLTLLVNLRRLRSD